VNGDEMSTASRSALATITMVNPAVVFADLDGEVVLLNTETGVYFGLEGAGALIWAMLADSAPEGAIVERLLDRFAVEPERARADLAAFLDQLLAKRLLVRRDVPATRLPA